MASTAQVKKAAVKELQAAIRSGSMKRFVSIFCPTDPTGLLHGVLWESWLNSRDAASMVRLLLRDNIIDMHEKHAETGMTPAESALFCPEVMSELVKAGLKVNKHLPPSLGNLLHSAICFYGKFAETQVRRTKLLDTLQVLLQAGADANVRDVSGTTPLDGALQAAAVCGDPRIVLALLPHTAIAHRPCWMCDLDAETLSAAFRRPPQEMLAELKRLVQQEDKTQLDSKHVRTLLTCVKYHLPAYADLLDLLPLTSVDEYAHWMHSAGTIAAHPVLKTWQIPEDVNSTRSYLGVIPMNREPALPPDRVRQFKAYFKEHPEQLGLYCITGLNLSLKKDMCSDVETATLVPLAAASLARQCSTKFKEGLPLDFYSTASSLFAVATLALEWHADDISRTSPYTNIYNKFHEAHYWQNVLTVLCTAGTAADDKLMVEAVHSITLAVVPKGVMVVMHISEAPAFLGAITQGPYTGFLAQLVKQLKKARTAIVAKVLPATRGLYIIGYFCNILHQAAVLGSMEAQSLLKAAADNLALVHKSSLWPALVKLQALGPQALAAAAAANIHGATAASMKEVLGMWDTVHPLLTKVVRGAQPGRQLPAAAFMSPPSFGAAASPVRRFAAAFDEKTGDHGSKEAQATSYETSYHVNCLQAQQLASKACAHCGLSALDLPGAVQQRKLMSCGACKAVYYCSKECHLADWKAGHKKACAGAAAARSKQQQ